MKSSTQKEIQMLSPSVKGMLSYCNLKPSSTTLSLTFTLSKLNLSYISFIGFI